MAKSSDWVLLATSVNLAGIARMVVEYFYLEQGCDFVQVDAKTYDIVTAKGKLQTHRVIKKGNRYRLEAHRPKKNPPFIQKYKVGDRVYTQKNGEGTVAHVSRVPSGNGYTDLVSVDWDFIGQKILGLDPITGSRLKTLRKI